MPLLLTKTIQSGFLKENKNGKKNKERGNKENEGNVHL